jgi:hypothetical protein
MVAQQMAVVVLIQTVGGICQLLVEHKTARQVADVYGQIPFLQVLGRADKRRYRVDLQVLFG